MNYIEEIKKLISNGKPDGVPTRVKHNKELFEVVNNYSNNCKNLSEKIYRYSVQKPLQPLCLCGKPNTFISLILGYREFCSRTCSYAKAAATERRCDKMLKNGGIGLANPVSKAAQEKTLQEKSGDPKITNPGQLKSNLERLKTYEGNARIGI
jgi:hypothetical protein